MSYATGSRTPAMPNGPPDSRRGIAGPQGYHPEEPSYHPMPSSSQQPHHLGSSITVGSDSVVMAPGAQHVVREQVVHRTRKVQHEKVVELPEVKYVEKVVEYPAKLIHERIKPVEKVEIRERVTRVPKLVTKEVVVEVPQIEYREVHVDKIVEVPKVREEVVVKEVPVPQYVDVVVPEYRKIATEHEVERIIPVPMEVVAEYECRMPKLIPKYKDVEVPIYVPRFIEVPVPIPGPPPSNVFPSTTPASKTPIAKTPASKASKSQSKSHTPTMKRMGTGGSARSDSRLFVTTKTVPSRVFINGTLPRGPSVNYTQTGRQSMAGPRQSMGQSMVAQASTPNR